MKITPKILDEAEPNRIYDLCTWKRVNCAPPRRKHFNSKCYLAMSIDYNHNKRFWIIELCKPCYKGYKKSYSNSLLTRLTTKDIFYLKCK